MKLMKNEMKRLCFLFSIYNTENLISFSFMLSFSCTNEIPWIEQKLWNLIFVSFQRLARTQKIEDSYKTSIISQHLPFKCFFFVRHLRIIINEVLRNQKQDECKLLYLINGSACHIFHRISNEICKCKQPFPPSWLTLSDFQHFI